MLLFFLAVLLVQDPSSIDGPRQDFADCISAFEVEHRKAKTEASKYIELVTDACPEEAAKLRAALIKFDVAMGTKREEAAAFAERDIEDYRSASRERFGLDLAY